MAGCRGYDAKSDGVSDEYECRLWFVVVPNAVEMTAEHPCCWLSLKTDPVMEEIVTEN